MGRYVNGKWHEELADPGGGGEQGNTIPVSSGGGGGGGGGGSAAPASAPSGYYQTVNGLQTLGSMEQQLHAAGWQGGEDVVSAYARTTGGAVSPTGTGPARPGTPSTPTVPGTDLASLQKFFGQTAGFSREELAERARQFNESLALTERQWEREGKPRLQIDQDLQALKKWQAEQDIALQQKQLALQQGQLGLNYLTTASQMGGPSDVFNQIDFLRGARARGDVPQFLGALAQNTQLPGFSGAGTTPQEAMTAAGLAAKLGGTAPITSYNPDQALAQIGSIFQRGATGLTPGSLEQLDPNELAVLKAGGLKLGYDPDAWLRAYQRAGIGQQASGPV
jgi:hypothetical protein